MTFSIFCLSHTACFDLLKQNDRKIEKICVPLASKVQKERDVGIFGFADLANVCFGFRTSKLRCFGFNFGVSCGLRVLSLWFSVFVNNDDGFSDSSAQCILRFFWFCQGSHTSQSRQNCNSKGPLTVRGINP